MKIRVTRSSEPSYWYANRIGETFDAEYGSYYGELQFKVADCRDGSDDTGYVKVVDCAVVPRPVEAPPLSERPADAQRDEIIANLSARVAELERDVRELKRMWTPRNEAEDRVEQLTRDDVIEGAKRDLDDLKATHHPTLQRYYVARNLTWSPECDEEFIINRGKRTVVCLLRKRKYNGKGEVQSKGIAKCAPDDVFNVHIGKAIALRRALGLTVPDEYVNAPKPTEVRVGDYVYYTSQYPRVLVTENETDCFAKSPKACIDLIRMTATEHSTNPVIDDSREEV